jgi:hypothetical protein
MVSLRTSFTRSSVQRCLKQIIIVTSAILVCKSAAAQDKFVPGSNYGLRGGIIFSFGTHFQRVGVNLNAYYIFGSFQGNSEARLYYNFRNLGPRLKYSELVLSQGIVYAYGKTATVVNPFITSVSNQTGQGSCISYAYNAYFNRVRTTQQTGTIHLGFGPFSFITENDILGKPALDRFRSGAFLLQYRYEDVVEAGISCRIWTGHFKKRAEIFGVPVFYNNCYMDSTGGTYTGYSHGILAVQAKMLLPYQQYAGATAGIDAEQVRNVVQNRLMHNMRFVPDNLNKAKNCHLPMIDENGGQHLYREGQKVRKPTPFLNISANENIFY